MSYQNFEVGFVAQTDPAGFSQLDGVFQKMKQNVDNLKLKIEAAEVQKKKIVNNIQRTVTAHARVSERLVKRRAMANEYKKTIAAVEGGYNGLVDSSKVLLEVLTTQMNSSDTAAPPNAIAPA
jgi:septation ring formation regulator EzrA